LSRTQLSETIDALERRDDPRLDEGFWRTVPRSDGYGEAIVVGVVHDHPASSFRVRAVARAFDPDVVALELPDVAVPAFERIAVAGGQGYEGGEMSAAIAASPDADAVGIDSVGPGFLRRLAGNARAEDASLGTVRDVLGDVAGIARHAVSCRFAGEEVTTRGLPADHGVTAGDDPAEQAEDERSTVARSRALLGAVERPHADLLLDDTREENMAARIDGLRTDGTVLAVVGMDHLDSVATRVV
jgi:pheromone shutdown protein TraB